MFGSSMIVDLPFDPSQLFSSIQTYYEPLDKSFVATALRTFSAQNSFDLIKWTHLSSDRACGTYIGGGKLKGMLLIIHIVHGRQAIRLEIKAPGYVAWIFLLFCIIGFCMPPTWLLLGLGYWSSKRHSELFLKKLSSDIKNIPMP